MILLLGSTGYIGQAFAAELRRRNCRFNPLSRKTLDYTDFDTLFDYVRRSKPEFLINAAGFTGSPNVDACETARAQCLQGNATFPQMVGRVSLLTRTPWGHVSSGCIYSGAKLRIGNSCTIVPDLSETRLKRLYSENPERFYGFTEADEPNFSFRSPPCSFYSGTKALAEEVLRGAPQCYIWRLRIPFDEFDHPRNFLSKIQQYPKVYDNVNSLSHRGDFVRACLELWERRAAFGAYNMTNPGATTTRAVVEKVVKILQPGRQFQFWNNDEDFYVKAAKAPRSNCILDSSKLLNAGVKMRSVNSALGDALNRWQVTGQTLRMAAGLDEKPDATGPAWLPGNLGSEAAVAQQWLRA